MNTITLPIAEALRPRQHIGSDHVVYRLPGHARDISHPFTREHGPLLVLGGTIDLPYLEWHTDPAWPCAGVMLAGKIDAGELSATMQRMPDPAVPVASFCGQADVPADFTAPALDETTLDAALTRFAPILRRLSEAPAGAAHADRSAMHILRMAYSRNCGVDARLTANLSNLVEYPLLGRASSNRLMLEGLALRGLLRRRHFMRTHGCADCASHRLLAFEACHGCGGSDLVDEPLVHHYRCGCQQPESNFAQGNALVCPKCRRGLRHFGMDYGKPGSVVHCRSCGTSAPEPDPFFVCLDCTARFGGQAAKAMDWFHYELTEAAIPVLRQGVLPQDDDIRSDGEVALCSMREFHLLASAGLRHARKSGIPLTIASCAPSTFAGLCERIGSARAKEMLRQAAHHIALALSDGDYVACAANCVLVGFAEWNATTSPALLAAACDAAVSALGRVLDLKIELHTGDEVAQLLEQY